MRSDRFHRLKGFIIRGIIANQNFIRNTRLPEQAFQLFADVFLAMISGDDNGDFFIL